MSSKVELVLTGGFDVGGGAVLPGGTVLGKLAVAPDVDVGVIHNAMIERMVALRVDGARPVVRDRGFDINSLSVGARVRFVHKGQIEVGQVNRVTEHEICVEQAGEPDLRVRKHLVLGTA